MDHFKNIYQNEAVMYHKLISAEDVDGNLFPTIERIMPINVTRVIDLGRGMGRIPSLLFKQVAYLVGLDLNWEMLKEQIIQKESIIR